MNEPYITYDESSSTEEFEKELKAFEISDTESSDRIYIKIETTKPQLKGFVDFYQKKELFYIKALKNLIIQNNFLELALQLEEGHITEEEYDKEIDAHPEKYVVYMDYLENQKDLGIIKSIIKKVGGEYTRDEVEELFSIDTENIESIFLDQK
ncbi:MAG: hypothetical protein ACOCP4_05710 [Candidatus Woesearchaeota archaeon]